MPEKYLRSGVNLLKKGLKTSYLQMIFETLIDKCHFLEMYIRPADAKNSNHIQDDRSQL